MNYGELLYKAHENNRNAVNKEVRCYKTEFAPPKKLERRVSSVNIQKFLARREEEEKKKKEEESRRKQELLALRSKDKKATRRVQTMLRATKSANKSVMEDAIDNVNTRDTLNGFKQCDEDDYGYTSQEANALYNKLLHKYETMPPEPPKFEPAKKEVKDLKAAKDRVRAALQKEAEEEMLPHKRKKRKHDDNEESSSDKTKDKKEDDDKYFESTAEEKKISKPPKPKRPAPPPMDFNQLLQIAKVKQFEPIMIDEALLKKEPERLMTKKQKLEAEKMASCRRNKDSKTGESLPLSKTEPSKEESHKKQAKTTSKVESAIVKKPELEKVPNTKNDGNKEKKSVSFLSQGTSKEKILGGKEAVEQLKKDPSVWTKTSSDIKTKNPVQMSKSSPKTIPKIEKKRAPDSTKTESTSSNKSSKPSSSKVNDLEKELQKMKAQQELLVRQLKEKEIAMKKLEESKKKEASISKPLKREPQKREPEKKLIKKPVMEKKKPLPMVNKRRIDSESEEYDSELDDFIDDGPDETNDYSKYISEIFGYDKNKYANVDDDDDECMESNFAQISKEEFVSTKIGIMEDLEDIRKEQEEKQRLKEKKLKSLQQKKGKKN